MSQLTPGSISANGRFVAYESFSADLAANDTNGTSDIFVRDLIMGSNEWVSANYVTDINNPGIPQSNRRSCAAARGADIAARCPYHAKQMRE